MENHAVGTPIKNLPAVAAPHGAAPAVDRQLLTRAQRRKGVDVDLAPTGFGGREDQPAPVERALRASGVPAAAKLFLRLPVPVDAQDGDVTAAGGPLLVVQERVWPAAWTADNHALLYDEEWPTGSGHVSILRVDGDRQPQEQLRGRRNPRGPSVSPDGRWLASRPPKPVGARSTSTPFRSSGLASAADNRRRARRRVEPRRPGDFYRGPDGVFSIRVDTTHGFSAGKPVRLFGGRYVYNTGTTTSRRTGGS